MLSEAELNKARSYARTGSVPGWLMPAAAFATIELASSLSIQGRPVCEIGVHQGKFAILLALLSSGRLVGYDLFSDDYRERSVFLSWAEKCLGPERDVEAVAIDSLDLSAERVLRDCGAPPVLFSVDGGHSAELTLNDLAIAAEAVAADGVVILDDFYNESWPETAFGTMQFLKDNPGTLTPFCIVGNKFMMARDAELARELAERIFSVKFAPESDVRGASWCTIDGHKVCLLSARGAPMSVRNALSRTELGRRLSQSVRAFRRPRGAGTH